MHHRLRWILALALAVGWLSAPPAVRAAEEHGQAAAPAAEHDAHDEHGGEAKSPLLSFDPGQAVWSIVVFLLLLGILRAFAWKPILQGLQTREKFIHDALDDAKRQRVEAEAMLKRYMEQINHAREEAAAIIDEGRRDAEVVRKRTQDEARAEAHAMLERAKRELGLARDDAIKALYQQSIELASQMAGKIVKKQLQPGDHQALLDESLKEIAGIKR